MGKSKKDKIFRDPVHNYINVPTILIENFIDTPIFQRLRSVEQTSYRPLFHCAHHDRFAHSLGVYHIASKLYGYLLENSSEDIIPILKDLKQPFLIAALMHDCAHAPFSHILEYFYEYSNKITDNLVDIALEKKFSNSFINDFLFKQHLDKDTKYSSLLKEEQNESALRKIKTKIGPSSNAQPHEIASAYIFVKHYSEAYTEIISNDNHCNHNEYKNTEIVARMITGCINLGDDEIDRDRRDIENWLIKLINGLPVDVDRLDYVMRDTYSMGINNVSIDLDRLLSSVVMLRDKSDSRIKLAFYSSAIDIVKDVVNARNLFPERVVNHHIIIYFKYLLHKSFESMVDKYKCSDSDDRYKLFGIDTFTAPVVVKKRGVFVESYLVSDGDIMHLLKRRNFRREDYIEEILSRKPKRIPLWKSIHEFNNIFTNKLKKKPYIINKILNEENGLKKILRIYLKRKIKNNEISIEDYNIILKSLNDILIIKQSVKLATIKKDQIYFVFESDIIREASNCGISTIKINKSKTKAVKNKEEESDYFIIYIPKALKNCKNMITNIIKEYIKNPPC